nr:MAG TPA: hypothetical protein [Caudoviricetes sp.]
MVQYCRTKSKLFSTASFNDRTVQWLGLFCT